MDQSLSESREHPAGECVSCGADAATPYCPRCGQPKLGRLTFRSLIRSGLRDLVDLDTGVLYTLRQLTLRPGGAVREYLEGRPRRYASPVKYAFVAATVLGLVGLLLPSGVGDGTPESDLVEATRLISGPWAYAIFVSALGVALLQRLLFLRESKGVAENYAFQLFLMGHLTWLMLLWVLINAVAPVRWLEPAVRLIEAAYMVWALAGFLGVRSVRIVVSGLLLWFVWKLLSLTTVLASTGVLGSLGP